MRSVTSVSIGTLATSATFGDRHADQQYREKRRQLETERSGGQRHLFPDG